MARTSRKKSWQTGRHRVSVNAALAIQRENVVNRLVRLRTEAGHPEKAGEPLPQDQAAALAGVTARQWQRWESGASVPYARNLSAVADAFGFDVGEFYDGPVGQQPAPTPTPFTDQDTLADLIALVREDMDERRQQRNEIIERLDRLEAALGIQVETVRDEVADRIRILGKAIVEGRPPEDEPDRRPTPARSVSSRKKRAAASRTPARP